VERSQALLAEANPVNIVVRGRFSARIDTIPGIAGLACNTTGQAKWRSDCGEQG
jgi:hypothetical protein